MNPEKLPVLIPEARGLMPPHLWTMPPKERFPKMLRTMNQALSLLLKLLRLVGARR